MRCEVVLVKLDLKFEISDGKNLVKSGGRSFSPANTCKQSIRRFGANFGGNFGEYSEISFQISWKLRSAEVRG